MSYIRLNKTYYETNYSPTQNTRVECKVSFVSGSTGSNDENKIFGRGYSYQSHLSHYSFQAFFFNYTNNFAMHIGGVPNDYGGSFQPNTEYTVSLSPTEWVYNGVSTQLTGTFEQYQSVTNFPIGAVYIVNTNSYICNSCTDFSYVKIYEGDTLVRNYVPRLYNGVACLYDTIGKNYLQPNDSSKATYVSSLDVTPSSKSFKASGGSETFTVDADADWSASTESDWITLSSSSGTSGTSTVTVTVPSYSGAQKRQGTITFTSGDETVNVTIKQAAPSSGSDTIRLGANAILGMKLGSATIEAAYIGETEFWVNSFNGIVVSPKTKTVKSSGGTFTIKVKASEDWSLASPNWITLSSLSGTSGTSEVTATCAEYTSTTENRVADITASTTSMTKTCTVTQKKITTLDVPDNWDFLLVFKTTSPNENVVLKGPQATQSFTYWDGENAEYIADGQSSYTFTEAGYHSIFYTKTSNDSYVSGYRLYKSTYPKVYGVYFNPTYMNEKQLPIEMFYCEGSFTAGDDIGKYLYIPEGVTQPSHCFSMYYFAQLETLVLPSTFTQGWNNYTNTDWTFCGMARCNTVYNFSGVYSPSAPTMFGYSSADIQIGNSVSGTKTQYYKNGTRRINIYGIDNFTGVELAAGATMASEGLEYTVEEWWSMVTE